jgi:hypothetical protein
MLIILVEKTATKSKTICIKSDSKKRTPGSVSQQAQRKSDK